MQAGTMPTKRKAGSMSGQEASKTGKKRVLHSMEVKAEVMRRKAKGETTGEISKAMGLAPSTIRSMMGSVTLKKLLQTTDNCKVFVTRIDFTNEGSEDVVMNMERLLKMWIDDQASRPGGITDEAIQAKAMSLWKFVYESTCSENMGDSFHNFTPSTEWLKQFKEKISFSSFPSADAESTTIHVEIKEQTEASPLVKEEGGADPLLLWESGMVARDFSSILRAKIEVGGYTPRQVINIVEMGLFWKKLPTNAVIAMDKTSQGPRASNDQFILMLGANAMGDLKLKPLIVYHLENPRSLQGYIKEHLPVIWRSHPSGSIVPALCQNYIVDYLSQRCKEYAMENNLENRFLLLVDGSPTHPPSMDDWADNIEVMFLPTGSSSSSSSSSSSVVCPLEQGITNTLKLCYLHRLLDQLIRETEKIRDNSMGSICTFWHGYNIRKAVNNVKMAWDDITPSTLNAVWGDIWPECVHESHFQSLPREPTKCQVASLAHRAGFLQVTERDIWRLIESQSEESSSTELSQIELDQTLQDQEEEEEETRTGIVKTLDVKLLGHMLCLLDEAMAVLEHNDPNTTRSCEARRLVENGIRGYRELYTAKKRKAQSMSILYSPDK